MSTPRFAVSAALPLLVLSVAAAGPPSPDERAVSPDSYRYYGPGGLWKVWSAEQRHGRDTWIHWTGGNEKFLRLAALLGDRAPVPLSVDLYRLLDSRNRKERFAKFGLINEPNCEGGHQEPDTGLWLDRWAGDPYKRTPTDPYPGGHYPKGNYPYYPDPKAYPEYGEPTGVVGLRKFRNPKFWGDEAAKTRWREGGDRERYFVRPGSVEPPYLVGFSCAFCHVAFDPTNPPKDAAAPRWENLAANVGNQYFREGEIMLAGGRQVFGDRNPGPNRKADPYDTMGLTSDSLAWHYAVTQQPGTSETSRISYDFINNPNTINPIFGLGSRPTFHETTPDGVGRTVHHVLKDGADSVGLATALLRVWINIGCEGRYWVDSLFNPATGERQKPFDIRELQLRVKEQVGTLTADEKARLGKLEQKYGPDVGRDWAEAHRRNPDLIAYLASYTPARLADAPGGGKHFADTVAADRGRRVFAKACASCHSSKQPGYETGPADRAAFHLQQVTRADFLANNFLSDDRRYSVAELGTNMARALATNAVDMDVWAEFSSKDYKALPPVGKFEFTYAMTPAGLAAKRPATRRRAPTCESSGSSRRAAAAGTTAPRRS